MCIVCNVPARPESPYVALDFLEAFAESRKAMRKAAESMLAILSTDLDPGVRLRYDRTHKEMRRQIRSWNSLEESRESAPKNGSSGLGSSEGPTSVAA